MQTESLSSGTKTTAQHRARSLLPVLFLCSLLVPMLLPVGPVVLMPHRIYLMAMFFPLLWMLLSGKAGPLTKIDLLLICSAIWASIAIFVSDGDGKVEAIGLYWVEFFGAYLIGRVCVRSAGDFQRFTIFFFIVVAILTPFVVLESVLHRAILLDLVPNSLPTVFARQRWGLRRAQAVFAHPILFGIFVSSAYGLFWWVIRPMAPKMIGAFASVISTFMSLSTGALISLTIQTILIIWEIITRPKMKRWRLFTILCVIAYIVVDLISNRTPFHVLVDYASFNSGSAYNRILIWEFGTNNVRNNPWFGLGLNVESWVRPTWMHASTDNYWLLVAMQYGLPTIITLVAAIFLMIRQVACAPLYGELPLRCRAGYLTAMGGIIVAGGTVHYWHSMQAFVMFMFGSGLWALDSANQSDPGDNRPASEEDEPVGTRYTRFSQKLKNREGHSDY